MAERVALVTGATGAVGPAVVRACQDAGYSVRTYSIDTLAGEALPPGVDARLGDICDARAVRSAVAGADVVLHLAALLHQFENVEALEHQYDRVNVGGTENVLQAALAEGVRRVMLLSTIAVYGPSNGLLLAEHAPPRPDTAYSRSKLAAERAVLSASSGGRPIGTVLRSAAVYGPRLKGNYRRLALAIARRRFVPVGACQNRRTVVHERDLARAAVLAADHPAAAGATFNVSDGQVHTLATIIGAIYRAVGRRAPRLHVPMPAVRAAAALCEGACRVTRVRPPLTRASLEKYTEDVAVDATLIQDQLGFAPTIALKIGWEETMAALHRAGSW